MNLGIFAPSSLVVLLALASCPAHADPPFSGTIFIDPDIITSSDPTTFQGATYAGRGVRRMFDRRVDDDVECEAYLFEATFDDGLTAEIQVNPEFGSEAAAQAEADEYGDVIGRLPTALRADVQTVWIHEGTEPFGGGNNNLLIHTGQSALYEADGILEETFVHEAAHTSLDAAHAEAGGWLDAQTADPEFISTYARDHPIREDVAESFLPYLAIRYRADRIDGELADTINSANPNRIDYFDAQGFDMYPVVPRPGDFNGDGNVDGADFDQWKEDYADNGDSDADHDDDSDGADFLIWQQELDAEAGVAAAVPEPSMTALAASLGAACIAVIRNADRLARARQRGGCRCQLAGKGENATL